MSEAENKREGFCIEFELNMNRRRYATVAKVIDERIRRVLAEQPSVAALVNSILAQPLARIERTEDWIGARDFGFQLQTRKALAEQPASGGERAIVGDLDKPFHKPECRCDKCERWRDEQRGVREATKTKRLFVASDFVTNGTPCICGGPDIDDAMRGLMNYLRPQVEALFAGDEQAIESGDVYLEIDELTDEEVANLGDI